MLDFDEILIAGWQVSSRSSCLHKTTWPLQAHQEGGQNAILVKVRIHDDQGVEGDEK